MQLNVQIKDRYADICEDKCADKRCGIIFLL